MCATCPMSVVAQGLALVPPFLARPTVRLLRGTAEWTPGHHVRSLLGPMILGIEIGTATTTIAKCMLVVMMIDDDLRIDFECRVTFALTMLQAIYFYLD